MRVTSSLPRPQPAAPAAELPPQWVPAFGAWSNDVDAIYAEVQKRAPERGLRISTLGHVGDGPLFLLTPQHLRQGPRVLISAGFHGEEPAGPWAVLHLLRTLPADLWQRINLSFLPLASPTAMRQARRTNDWGENSNRGFPALDPGMPIVDPLDVAARPSREGAILIAHRRALVQAARDGLLSLHEDSEVPGHYRYLYREDAGSLGPALSSAQSRYFAALPGGSARGDARQSGTI
jgi:hypothetical protein